MRTKFFRGTGVFTVLAVSALMLLASGCDEKKEVKKVGEPEKNIPERRMIYGQGYVRGSGQTTLKNKYAGFVSKVYFYSQAKVKKGDVILEYDDHELRTKIQKAEHVIIELEKDLNRKKLELDIKKLDPLPPITAILCGRNLPQSSCRNACSMKVRYINAFTPRDVSRNWTICGKWKSIIPQMPISKD